MNMKLALAIGHGPRIDEGAENKDGTTELAWNRGLAEMIADELQGSVVQCSIVHRSVERNPPVAAVNKMKAGMTVELHLNASNGSGHGTEMIYHPGSVKGRRLATILQRRAVAALGTRDRGIKGPQGGGRGAAFLKKTNCPAVIVESFFIDNDGDLAKGNAKKAHLAKAYADGFIEFAT